LKKWQIALQGIDLLLAEDLPVAPVVGDAGTAIRRSFAMA
jgi:hypothetical protein